MLDKTPVTKLGPIELEVIHGTIRAAELAQPASGMRGIEPDASNARQWREIEIGFNEGTPGRFSAIRL